MHIYIDESGSFKAENKKASSISCVSALIIPDEMENSLFKAFNEWKLSPALQSKKNKFGEIKGSKLNEKEIASFLNLLSFFDILVETACIDLGSTTEAEVNDLKEKYANSFSRSQTGHKLNSQFERNVIMSLSQPLFLQSLSLCDLINRVLTTSITYYAQRFPKELGSFQWILDAKDNNITTYERMFAHFVKPFLQNINLQEETFILEGEDYSAFDEYLIPAEYELFEPLKNNKRKKSLIYSIDKIMKNINFVQSHKNIGLELVDIITNCIKRALSGNLQFEGWKYLTSLLVSRSSSSVTLTHLNKEYSSSNATYIKFINYIQKCGKQMLVPENLKPLVKRAKKGYIKWCFHEQFEENIPLIKKTIELY